MCIRDRSYDHDCENIIRTYKHDSSPTSLNDYCDEMCIRDRFLCVCGGGVQVMSTSHATVNVICQLLH